MGMLASALRLKAHPKSSFLLSRGAPMAITSFGVGDALAVKLWSKSLDNEALKFTDVAPLIGDGPNAIIHRKTEMAKGPGDRVTYGIRMQLAGAGFTENQLAEGNAESLSIYTDGLVINELGHNVGVKGKGTIDQQRVPFDLRTEARDGLADWWAKRYSVSFFNQVCGFTLQTDPRFTGLNPVTAPSRIIRQGSRASDDLLLTTDTFSINLIDKAKEAAITATPKVRPITFRGGRGDNGRRDFNATLTDKFLMYLHPYQVTDMRTSTSTGQWLDITKAATQGNGARNPIMTGAIGEYNGVVLRSSYDVTPGISAGGVVVPNVARAVLLGGQACMIGYGQKDMPGRYRWNEELFDHKRRMEVSAWSIFGLKKTTYNGLDYGVVVVSTYAAAHL
jgi:N4-gp56 family major capsid protein